MDYFCNNCDAIFSVLISGILGAIGQALRIGIGLYKLSLGKNPLLTVAELSIPSKKQGVIFLGFTVGILITVLTKTFHLHFSLERIIALITSGYAVTHAIEGAATTLLIKKKSIPKSIDYDTTAKNISYTPVEQSPLSS